MKKLFLASKGIPGTKDFYGIVFSIASDKAHSEEDLVSLTKEAMKEYGLTKEGFLQYCHNKMRFSWEDMARNINGVDFSFISVDWIAYLCKGLGSSDFEDICKEAGIQMELLGIIDSQSCCLD